MFLSLEEAFTISLVTAQPFAPVTVTVTVVLLPFTTVTIDELEVIAVATSHDTGVGVDVGVGFADGVNAIFAVAISPPTTVTCVAFG
jgi:hypothetical protein